MISDDMFRVFRAVLGLFKLKAAPLETVDSVLRPPPLCSITYVYENQSHELHNEYGLRSPY